MGSVAVLMNKQLLELVAEALAEIYSGATTLEAEALIDKLDDRGFVVCLITDVRALGKGGRGYSCRLDEQIVKVTAPRWPDTDDDFVRDDEDQELAT